MIGGLIEPAFGLLGDSGRRRRIVVGGGIAFVAALVLAAGSWSLLSLFVAFVLLSPASGAFVSLSQATLMDLHDGRHERAMAAWTLAGSVGVVAGPLALAAAQATGLGWRGLLIAFCLFTIPVIALVGSVPFAGAADGARFTDVLGRALQAARRREVLRWLVLLELSDLLGDVLTGYLALYFVDVARVSALQATLAVAVWTGAGLVGDAALVAVIARIPTIGYLRVSAALAAILYSSMLLAPDTAWKLVLVGLLGIVTTGWYAIPKGRLFAELAGASGTAVALSDGAAFVGRLFPLAIGILAERLGLAPAMWVLLVAPVALLVGLPRSRMPRISGGG
jgi:FSR family fosmidomycin resistance protein-like MFS transporter